MTVGRARLDRYVWWQVRDFARERGLGLALVLAAITIGVSYTEASVDGERARLVGGAAMLARLTFGLATSLSTVFVIVAFNGIVSTDRTQGFARFYYAKPLDPAAFYARKWLAHAAGLLAIVGAWLAILTLVHGAFDVGPTLAAVALRIILYGGLLFLASSLVSAEIGVFSAVYLAGELARLAAGSREWAQTLVTWVFPWLRLSPIDERLAKGGDVPALWLAHVIGAGGLAILAGLLVLRRRRLQA